MKEEKRRIILGFILIAIAMILYVFVGNAPINTNPKVTISHNYTVGYTQNEDGEVEVYVNER